MDIWQGNRIWMSYLITNKYSVSVGNELLGSLVIKHPRAESFEDLLLSVLSRALKPVQFHLLAIVYIPRWKDGLYIFVEDLQ